MTKCVLFAVLIFALASLASSFPEPYPYKPRTTNTTTPAPYKKHHKREAQPEPYQHKPATTTTTTPAPHKKYQKREALPEPNPYKPTTTTTPTPYKKYHKREALPEPHPQYVFGALLKDHPSKATGSGTGYRYKRNAQGGFLEDQANVKCSFCFDYY